MQKKYCTLFIFAFLFSASRIFSQDFHLSQYDEAPLNLNPALTGLYNGTFRVHSHYRTQWNEIASHPYVTALLSGEQRLKNISAGVQIADQRAGTGNYNVLSLQASASYDKALDSSKNHHISFGLQAGFEYKSVDLARLTFESQYVTTNGGGFDNSLWNGEANIRQTSFLPDVNAGLLYYFAKGKTRFNPFIGVTAFHITYPKESFFSENNRLPVRFLVHAGSKINITSKFQLVPKFLYMRQTNDQEMAAGMDLNFFLPGSNTFFILGSTYRNEDAIIGFVGLKTGRCTYKVSYDVNNSSLKTATGGRGGFEISFTLTGSKYKPITIPACPRTI